MGDSEKEAKIHVSGRSNTGMSSLVFKPVGISGTSEVTTVDSEQVHVITLDGFAKKKGLTKIDIVKIDVEGSDYHVLLGMPWVLKELGPKILIEIEPQIWKKSNYTPDDVQTYLKDFGYRPFKINQKIDEIDDLTNIERASLVLFSKQNEATA